MQNKTDLLANYLPYTPTSRPKYVTKAFNEYVKYLGVVFGPRFTSYHLPGGVIERPAMEVPIPIAPLLDKYLRGQEITVDDPDMINLRGWIEGPWSGESGSVRSIYMALIKEEKSLMRVPFQEMSPSAPMALFMMYAQMALKGHLPIIPAHRWGQTRIDRSISAQGVFAFIRYGLHEGEEETSDGTVHLRTKAPSLPRISYKEVMEANGMLPLAGDRIFATTVGWLGHPDDEIGAKLILKPARLRELVKESVLRSMTVSEAFLDECIDTTLTLLSRGFGRFYSSKFVRETFGSFGSHVNPARIEAFRTLMYEGIRPSRDSKGYGLRTTEYYVPLVDVGPETLPVPPCWSIIREVTTWPRMEYAFSAGYGYQIAHDFVTKDVLRFTNGTVHEDQGVIQVRVPNLTVDRLWSGDFVPVSEVEAIVFRKSDLGDLAIVCRKERPEGPQPGDPGPASKLRVEFPYTASYMIVGPTQPYEGLDRISIKAVEKANSNKLELLVSEMKVPIQEYSPELKKVYIAQVVYAVPPIDSSFIRVLVPWVMGNTLKGRDGGGEVSLLNVQEHLPIMGYYLFGNEGKRTVTVFERNTVFRPMKDSQKFVSRITLDGNRGYYNDRVWGTFEWRSVRGADNGKAYPIGLSRSSMLQFSDFMLGDDSHPIAESSLKVIQSVNETTSLPWFYAYVSFRSVKRRYIPPDPNVVGKPL
jgi:hypothetical protein